MRYWVIVFLFLCGEPSFSQKKPDAAFLNHLMNREYYKELIFLLDKTNIDKYQSSFRDSLYYMKGWSYYALKKLNQSSCEFKRVSASSTFYHKSRFFSAYNYLYLGDTAKARITLDNIWIRRANMKTLQRFERAGMALMSRDFDKFDRSIDFVDTTYYAVAMESSRLNKFVTELKNHRKKSPLLAGVMSSLIPGSGKIYGGNTGEGISTLLTVGGLGLVTWENYRKKGLSNFRTLFFSAVFTAFYIGNIYGTVFSVKIAEEEFQNEYDHKILFNLHIPLRNVFN